MDGLFDRQELEIPCPHCRTKLKKTIGELKQPGVKCPRCGASFETSQLTQQLDQVERSLGDLQRNIKNVKINVEFRQKCSE